MGRLGRDFFDRALLQIKGHCDTDTDRLRVTVIKKKSNKH